MTIIEKIMVICMQLLREPWRNVLDVNPVLDRLETNPQFAQIISPNDMTALIALNMKIGDVDGMMTVCLPFPTMEDIIERLNTTYWYSNLQESRDENYEEHIGN